MKDKLQKIFLLVIKYLVYIVANIVPKKRDLWVFGGWFGKRYSDNPKAFFEYVNSQQPSIETIWLAKDKTVVAKIRKLGQSAYLAESVIGTYLQFRAEMAFVCQALPDDLFSPAVGKKTKVVNLWHGLPLKKIMYDVFGDRVCTKNKWGKFVDAISPYDQVRNDYLLATSVETQNTLSKAFRLDKCRTLITGFPRNDVFLNNKAKTPEQSFRCIYMPTFRLDPESDLFEHYGFNAEEIDQHLSQHNVQLVLRMHPINKPPAYLVEQIAKSQSISIDNSGDIFDSIASYDCMITDYSGGYFDFILSNRPILFAPFDLDKYKAQERDLYYDYEEVTLAPYAKNWSELIENIINLKQHGSSAAYQQAYDELKDRFHQPIEELTFSETLYKTLEKLR